MTSRIVLLAVLPLLMACEGEPPKTAAGSAYTPSSSAEPSAEEEEHAGAAPTPSGAPSASPSTACSCCACGGADAGSADASVEAIASAAPIAPPAPTSFAIAGEVRMGAKPVPFGVVYLEDAPIEPNAKMTAHIDNKAMTFAPFVTVIPAGGKIVFHNSDPFPHNVFSPDAEKFNMGTISHEQAMVHTFAKPGAYSLLCNLHPGMLGYVVVSPSSYFAKTDAKGHYAIKGVRAGTYKASAWGPRLSTTMLTVTVKDGDATLDFDLHR